MKRQLAFLWTLLVLLTVTNMSYAQITTTVADGTVTNEDIPVSGLFGDADQHQQVIYPANMLADMIGGEISSITWYLGTLPDSNLDCSFLIRLGEVDIPAFQSVDYLPITNTTVVYSGLLTVNANTGQLIVDFTSPFTYTGGNLLLDVQITAGTTYQYLTFIGASSANASISSNEWQQIPSTPVISSFIPKTTFTYTGGATCLTPVDLTVVNTDASSATVSWLPSSSGAQYQVFCDTVGAVVSEAAWVLTSDSFYTFHNLTPDALQTAYVRSYCGGATSGVISTSFYTDCDVVVNSFPWSEGFEENWKLSYAFGQQNVSPQCWRIYNGGTTTHDYGSGTFYWKPNQNASQVRSGQRSAVFYSEYAIGNHNDWLISPRFNLSGEQRVTFYVRNNTPTTDVKDEISVWISDENVTLQAPVSNADALPGFSQLFQTEIPSGDYHLYEISLAGYSGQRYIAFVRRNVPDAGWYLCLDDITVENIPPCAMPTALNAVSSSHEAQLSWEAESDYYNLYYKAEGDSAYLSISNINLNSDSTYILSGLTSGTTYQWYVEAVCNNGSLMPSAVSTFNTACAPITSVPQSWDFESNILGGSSLYPLPACWERRGSLTYPYVYENPYIAHCGNACLFSGGQVSNAMVVLPQIAVSELPINTLQVRFLAKFLSGSNATIEVGLMSDLSDISTFTSIQAIQNLTSEYVEYKVSFAHVSTTATYVVIRFNPNDGNIYLDDLVLEEIPACEGPTNLVCSQITAHSVTINWSSSSEEHNIYCQVSGSGGYIPVNEDVVTDMSYTIDNLIPNTLYNVYVSTVCLDSTEIASLTISFTTECVGLDTVPYICGFENNNTSGSAAYPMQACWSRTNASASSLYVSNVSAMAHSGSHSLYSIYPNNFVVVMPVINTQSLPLNDLQLTFYAKTNYGRNASVEVGVISDPSDPSGFESLAVFYLTMDYQQYNLVFTPYTGQANRLAFRLNSYTDYVLIDDVVLDVAPPCPMPYDFTCVSTDATSVTLSWNPGGDEHQWELTYGVSGFNPDTASMIIQTGSPEATISGLADSATYDFYVRALCGGDDGISVWRSLYAVMPGRYYMRSYGTDTLYTCGATIYDNGGPTGDYSSNYDSYLVIYPSDEHGFVSVSGTLTAESCQWDYLMIYDGVGAANEVYRSEQDGYSTISIPAITSTTGPLTLYFHSDNSVEKQGFVINTTCVSCIAPNPVVTTVGMDSVTISWSSTGASYYELVYGAEGFNPDAAQPILVTGVTSYTISNLVPDQTIDIRLKSYCDETSISSWSSAFTVSTLPHMPATIPYIYGFENGMENSQWTLCNGDQVNAWYINSAVNNTPGGDSALYISNDFGQTNSYQQDGAKSVVWAYRDFHFPDGDEFLLSFDWRNYGEGYYSYLWDYLSVYIGNPVKVDAGDSSEPNGVELIGHYMQNSSWSTAEYVMGSEFANTTKRLYFLWRNDVVDGDNPPAAIDNISLRAVNCARPVEITVSDVTTTTAAISVMPAATDEMVAWQLKYGNNMVVTVTDDVYVLSGLTSATEYDLYARSICANGDTSRWTPAYKLLTACQAIGLADMPYSFGFEDHNYLGDEDHPFPVCWSKISSSNIFPYVYPNGAHSGQKCLRSGEDPINYIVALPELNTEEIPIDSLQINFYAKLECYYDSWSLIEVGVMTNPNEESSFVPVDTLRNLRYAYSEQEVLFNHYSGEGAYIAFRITARGSYDDTYGFYSPAELFIDDVTVGFIPSCRKPHNLVCVGNTTTSAVVSWSPKGSENEWELSFGVRGFNPNGVNPILVDTTVYKLEDLTNGAEYDIYVRAHCGNLEVSEWLGPLTVIPGVYNMNTSGTDTIYACDIIICDNGGIYGNYDNDCNAYLVVYPDQPGRFVEISGTLNAEYYEYDYLVIYDGVGPGEELFHSHQMDESYYTIPSCVSSTGPITIYFKSDYTSNYAGFVLQLSCVSCLSPVLSLISVNTDSAVVSWTGSADFNYELVYGPQGFSPNAVTPILVSNSNTYVLSALGPNITYDVYVRVLCDDNNQSAWSSPLTFTTLPSVPARVPYFCDFEDENERTAWTFKNDGQTNKWYVNTPESADHILYVSGDGGQTNMYDQNSSSNVWAYRDIQALETAELVLTFDWRCMGELMYDINFDYLKLYYGDVTMVQAGSSDTPEGTVQLDLLNMEASWMQAEYSLGTVEAGAVKRLYFLWHNDNTEGNNPAAAIDNIMINAIHCAQPAVVNVSDITAHSATVKVSHADENAVGWQLQYGESDPITVVGDSVYLMTDLTAAQTYEVFVRSICNNGDTSVWTSYMFITDCDALGANTLPYICDFEYNNIAGTRDYPLPACWKRTDSQYPYVDLFSYGAYQGSRYLYSGIDATDFYVILPEINTEEVLINQLQLGFYARISSEFSGTIDVGVMTNPDNPQTFVPQGTVSALTWDYQEFEIPLSQYSGSGSYVAMRLNSTGGFGDHGEILYSLLYIDNITLGYIPDCQHPDALTQDNITTHSVDLSWSEVADSYNVYYRAFGTNNYDSVTNVTMTNSIYTLTGLQAFTTYEWYVASVCANGSVVPSHTTNSFTTLCETIDVFPYQETFENGLGCWVSSILSGDEWQWQTSYQYEYGGDYDNPNIIGAAEGNYYAQADYPGYGNAYRLFSPVFDLSDMQEPYIKFYHVQLNWDDDLDNLRIYYQNSPEVQPVLLVSYESIVFPWHLDSLALPNPTAHYQLFFDAYLNWGYGIGVDQVTIYDNHNGSEPPVVEWPVVVTDTATNITQTSANLHGVITDFGNQTITLRGFEWKQSIGGSSYTQVTDTGTTAAMTYVLTGLTDNTSYTYRAFVSTADTTIYGAEVSFVTLEEVIVPTCDAPANLQVFNITANSAMVKWTAGGDETTWVVEHKLQSANDWQTQNVSDTLATLDNLNPSSTYQVRVKAVCEDLESDYIATLFITSVGVCDMAYAQNILLMPNPADDHIELYIKGNVLFEAVDIYNAMGQWIQRIPLQDQHASISLEHITSGLYFVRLSSEQGVVTKKFIKK